MADTEGFEEFYIASVGRLLGQLFPVTGDLHEAEEIVPGGVRQGFDPLEPAPGLRRPRSLGAAGGHEPGRRPRPPPPASGQGAAPGRCCPDDRPARAPPGAGRRRHPRGRHARPRPRHPPRPLARLDLHRDLSGAGFVITQMHRDLASVAEPCAGGSRRAELVGYVRSQQYRRLVMVVAVPPEPDETSVCWTAEMFELGGAGRWTCR